MGEERRVDRITTDAGADADNAHRRLVDVQVPVVEATRQERLAVQLPRRKRADPHIAGGPARQHLGDPHERRAQRSDRIRHHIARVQPGINREPRARDGIDELRQVGHWPSRAHGGTCRSSQVPVSLPGHLGRAIETWSTRRQPSVQPVQRIDESRRHGSFRRGNPQTSVVST